MTGSAYSTTVTVPTNGFSVTEGQAVVGGLHSDEFDHMHCDWCKSWVFTQPREDIGFVNVRATMLDEHAWYVPFVETSRAEGFPWVATGATHSFPNIPPNESWGPLVAEFQQRGARP